MFNLNAIVKAFNLTAVEAGSYKDHHGFVLTYRPSYNSLDEQYGVKVASTSFIDAEDLFNSLISYDEITVPITVTKSMVDFVARLEKVMVDYTDYSVTQLMEFVTKYEDRYSQNSYDEIRFYGSIRQDLYEETFRLGSDQSTLAALYNVAGQVLHYREDYNS